MGISSFASLVGSATVIAIDGSEELSMHSPALDERTGAPSSSPGRGCPAPTILREERLVEPSIVGTRPCSRPRGGARHLRYSAPYLCEGMWVCLISIEAERDKIGNETAMRRMLLKRTIGSKPKLLLIKLPISRPSPSAMYPIIHIVAFKRD